MNKIDTVIDTFTALCSNFPEETAEDGTKSFLDIIIELNTENKKLKKDNEVLNEKIQQEDDNSVDVINKMTTLYENAEERIEQVEGELKLCKSLLSCAEYNYKATDGLSREYEVELKDVSEQKETITKMYEDTQKSLSIAYSELCNRDNELREAKEELHDIYLKLDAVKWDRDITRNSEAHYKTESILYKKRYEDLVNNFTKYAEDAIKSFTSSFLDRKGL